MKGDEGEGVREEMEGDMGKRGKGKGSGRKGKEEKEGEKEGEEEEERRIKGREGQKR